jgi:cation diffusion facilitator family transporter
MSQSHSRGTHSHSHGDGIHTHENEGFLANLGAFLHLPGFGHKHENQQLISDLEASDNALAIRTVWIALFILGLTTLIQIGIYVASSSVALLADTVHNLGDALNSIPLLVAFYLARRPANHCYSYGYGRAEDIAGILIVVSIAFSATYILWESIQKLINPAPLTNLGWVAAAAIVGFIGNELVAIIQIRVGRQIASEAMIADGQHARADGFTSLAVLIAAAGTWLGFPILDPIIGLLIGVTIVGITWSATKAVWYRLMDAVDPGLMNRLEHYASEVPRVETVTKLRAHWVGHRLYAEMTVVVDEAQSLVESHSIAEKIRQVLQQAEPHLSELSLSVVPRSGNGSSPTSKTDEIANNLAKILPPQYVNLIPSPAPMGAAGLQYDSEGQVAWDEIWTAFCDLALADGPPHRGTLLEPVNLAEIEANPEGYAKTIKELERGLRMVTGLNVVQSSTPGWIGLECESEEMALWLLRAIVVENISVRREDKVLYFPAGANFELAKEIKNIITVVAKTNHYWQDHVKSNLS